MAAGATLLLFGGAPTAPAASVGGAAAHDLIAFQTYSRESAESFALFTISPDGSGLRRIAYGENAALSWAGTRLLYVRQRGLAEGDRAAGIVRGRPDGSGARVVVSRDRVRRAIGAQRGVVVVSSNGGPKWSLDDRQMVFGATWEVAEGRTRSLVLAARADGSRLRRVTAGQSPVWTRGGRRPLCGPGRSGRRIVSVRRDGRRGRVLARIAAPSFPVALAPSPDGRRLAWLQFDGTDRRSLHVLDLQSRRRQTFSVSGNVRGLGWTPGGTRLAYWHEPPTPMGTRTPPSRLYTARPDGGGRRHVLTLPEDEESGMWASELSWRTVPGGAGAARR